MSGAAGTSKSQYDSAPVGEHATLDRKDARSHKVTAEAAHQENKEERQKEQEKDMLPTEVAKSHGNEPSRGAVVDEEIMKEEQEYLESKGKA